jgi:hypothetical protein
VLGATPTDNHVSLLQCIFGAEQNVFGFPEFLRFDKIDPMFRLIRFALLRIEFEVHEDVRNGLTTWKRLVVHAVVELYFGISRCAQPLNTPPRS